MNVTIRAIDDEEVLAFRRSIARGFGADLKDEDCTRFRTVFEIPRTVAAFDGSEIVGTGAAFSFDVTVPGGTLPMGGTTIITVQPTHRRRGVLTSMMRAHFADIRERNEPLAGLWASESSIYGSFGYGLAAEGHEVKVDGRTVEFIADPPPGRVRLVTPEAGGAVPFRSVYERVRAERPGVLTRTDAWWEHNVFGDPEWDRRGASMKRFALYEDAGRPQGYAVYRQKEQWEDFPDSQVNVIEIVAATSEAHQGLWQFLTRIDLYPNVRYWNAPTDDELQWLVTQPRRVRRAVTDSLWLRVLDVPRALTKRAYDAEGRLVLGIRDQFLPENDGRYELDVAGGGATCRPTTDDADIELDIDTLGALYFNAHRFLTLARAGLVKGNADALARADRLFAWETAAWCPEVF